MNTPADDPQNLKGLAAVFRNSAVRYLIAGGTAFLFDVGVLALFREVLGWPTWLSAAAAFLLSFVFTYTIQRTFAFESRTPHGTAILRYTLLVAFNTVATAVVVTLFDLTPAGWLVGKFVATGATTTWNYFAYRYWVFRSEAPAKEG